MTQDKKKTALWKKLLTACLAPLVLFVPAEIICRIFYPPRPNSRDPVPHEILNHAWEPYAYAIHDQFLNLGVAPYHLRFNTQGWREDYDVARLKPSHTFRVFYLGDSFTEGTCEKDDCMPSVVQRTLSPILRRHGLRVEVINAGCSSYSPFLYYLVVRHYVLSCAPDLVVVNVDMSDVFDDHLYGQNASYDDAGMLSACPPNAELREEYVRTPQGMERKTSWRRVGEAAQAAAGFLETHSRFIQALTSPVQYIGRPQRPPGHTEPERPDPTLPIPELFAWCARDWSPETESRVGQSMEALRNLLRLAKSRGVRVAVTGIPHPSHFTNRYSQRPLEAIRAVCTAEQVPYIDTYGGILRRAGTGDPLQYYIPRDFHFNTRGYALWAAIQVEALVEPKNHLLPERMTGSVGGA